MRLTYIIGLLVIIIGGCSIERVEKPFGSDADYYHATVRKHDNKFPGCDLYFELDDGTVIVPYMLNGPLMMPEGQEVEIAYTVMEDINSGCEGGISAQITELRQVGCGPVIDLRLDWALELTAHDGFNIASADMEEDCLKLKVSYSGGCAIHEFVMYAEPLPAFDDIQGVLTLAHYGHGDECDGVITDTVSFDLSSLQRRNSNYSRFSLSKADNTEGGIIYIDYYY